MDRMHTPVPVSEETLKKLLIFQRTEITEYHIYSLLAAKVKDEENRRVLERIDREELAHSEFYRRYTQKNIKPQRRKVFFYYWAARIFGLTFTLKLMEKGEERAQSAYMEIFEELPEVRKIAEEEKHHEYQLLNLITEEHLDYVGSIVLGLNDALVELPGTLAGLTFALQTTRLIALAGLITGIAASFSMGASEYLSTKAEGGCVQEPFKSAVYTWIAYLITVAALILPYLLLKNYLFSLGITLLVGILIILVFNFYISVVKDLPFRRRFWEMTAISLGVAALSFSIGYVIRLLLGVEI